MNRPGSFVEPSQQHIVKQQSPNPIVDLFKTDILPRQHRAHKKPAVLELNLAGRGDLADLRVAGILRLRAPFGHRSGGADVAAYRHGSLQGLMGANLVVFSLKVVEAVLLIGKRCLGRTRRLGLERPESSADSSSCSIGDETRL